MTTTPDAVLAAINAAPTVEDRAILALMGIAGLRPDEVDALDTTSYTRATGAMVVKGVAPRIIRVPAAAAQRLNAHLDHEQLKPGAFLFPSAARAAAQASPIGIHEFRATAARVALGAGIDGRALDYYFGIDKTRGSSAPVSLPDGGTPVAAILDAAFTERA